MAYVYFSRQQEAQKQQLQDWLTDTRADSDDSYVAEVCTELAQVISSWNQWCVVLQWGVVLQWWWSGVAMVCGVEVALQWLEHHKLKAVFRWKCLNTITGLEYCDTVISI